MTETKQEFMNGLLETVEDVKTEILQDIDHHNYKLNLLTKIKAFIADELLKLEQSIESCP